MKYLKKYTIWFNPKLSVKFKRFVFPVLLITSLYLYANCLPDVLFDKPFSYTITDFYGNLLGGKIAEDGQWRFPYDTAVPEKFSKCLIAFEDKRFYSHMGIDLYSVCRAVGQNLSLGKKVSGASTLSMQVIRLSRNTERNFYQKIVESIMATRLELKFSKKEILAMYANNAPFGGNVVGINTASWRYYGKPSTALSWSEAATLAILPNNPSIIRPGKNIKAFKAKRDRLLKKLLQEKIINSTDYALALLEPMPGKPLALPSVTPHLLNSIISNRITSKDSQHRQIKTTIDIHLQERVNEVIGRHFEIQSGNGVNNLSAIVVDVHSGNVLVYTGNINKPLYKERESEVDNVISKRSTGSVLKPFLYAAMLDEGMLLPEMLIPDIPIFINQYSPKNFNAACDGAVPADKALSRSLNIPAVNMLQQYTPVRFLHKLRKLGFTTFKRPADDYGLTLILGGGETSLLELAGVYASMARTLNIFNEEGKYYEGSFSLPTIISVSKSKTGRLIAEAPVLSAASIYQTFESMVKVSRPDEEKFWGNFGSAQKIAWKTGTSFGNRDAWAIGVTPQYVVGVWVGNSNGTGRAGLTGISAAAPVLFDIFNLLPANQNWFDEPKKEMILREVCAVSGFLATDNCMDSKKIWVVNQDFKNLSCPFHHIVHLDKSQNYRVHADCEKMSETIHKSWFVLPPSMEKFYKLSHPDYKILPRVREDCMSDKGEYDEISLLYPQNLTSIYLPVNLDGNRSSVVFEAAHRNLSASLFWHIDESFVGQTIKQHQQSLILTPGKHKLTLVDDAGFKLEQEFQILGKL